MCVDVSTLSLLKSVWPLNYSCLMITTKRFVYNWLLEKRGFRNELKMRKKELNRAFCKQEKLGNVKPKMVHFTP